MAVFVNISAVFQSGAIWDEVERTGSRWQQNGTAVAQIRRLIVGVPSGPIRPRVRRETP
jgi:hypothetical protein